MALHPKVPKDLALAPVAAEIDLNLQRLRDKGRNELDTELQLELSGPPTLELSGPPTLELSGPPTPNTREGRAAQVLRVAFRDVDAHGWAGSITDDACRPHLVGGSVTLDLGLRASVMEYIENGTK
jgi:hypothetical protein